MCHSFPDITTIVLYTIHQDRCSEMDVHDYEYTFPHNFGDIYAIVPPIHYLRI